MSRNTASALSASRRRGAFIVFEGIDRSGKSSQSELLYNHLKKNGVDVQHMRFPDRQTEIGRLLGGYLRGDASACLPHQTIHLLFSANRWEKIPQIKKYLEEGITVIADRFAFSGVAYSSGALGLDMEWCKNPDRGLLSPDIVFYLDIDPHKAAQRRDFGGEIYENLETQLKVHQAYETFKNDSFWHVVDASQSIEVIKAVIKEKCDDVLRSLPYLTSEAANYAEQKTEMNSSPFPPPLWIIQ